MPISTFRQLLSLLCLVVLAQPAQAQTFYLDLNPQRLQVPGRTLYVEQVVDGRLASGTAVGAVYQGLNISPGAVEFRRGLEPELTEWLQRHLPARPGDQPVVLCVRRLQVQETLSGLMEHGTVELAFDVYAHLPDGYHFVRRLSDYAGHRGRDLTSTYAPQLAVLLQQCLRSLAPAPWALAAQQPALRLEQLAADQPAIVERPAILRATAPQRGVYYTAGQFLANRPDTTVSLTVETIPVKAGGWASSPQLRPLVRTAKGQRLKAGELWGLSDGQQAYIQQGGTLELLVQQDDVYTFMGSPESETKAAPIQLIYSPIPGSPGFITLTRPVPVPGGFMVIALDMHTSQAGPYPRPGQTVPADTAYVYVYRPPGGSRSTPPAGQQPGGRLAAARRLPGGALRAPRSHRAV
jgi:hypothetical protein